MSNFLTLVVLVLIAAALGVVVGEAYAPISGDTVQALSHRLNTAESKVDELETRCENIDARLKAIKTQPLKPQ